MGHAAGSAASVAGTYSHLFSSAAAAGVGADTKTPVQAMPIFWYKDNRQNVTSSEDNINISGNTQPHKLMYKWIHNQFKIFEKYFVYVLFDVKM